jgi:very-short-patch-repair endonuclease
MPHSVVSKEQRSKVKELRRTMTRAETLLWRYVKAGHLNGLQFRRQAPMGQYIVDFVCHGARIVVELDGETHDFAERVRRDRTRDA